MANVFNSIKVNRPKTSTHDLTHDVKFSFKAGNLVPCMAIEVVPGDRFKISMDGLIRMAPMISPAMHRYNFTTHYFFVPNRILWDNWEKFITPNLNVVAPVAPYFEASTTFTDDQKRFLQYMGIPFVPGEDIAADIKINALPMAAYQMIYNEYYRDQDLVAEVPFKLSNGLVPGAQLDELVTLRNRAYEHDYFTSARPWPQKGPAVDIPLGNVILAEQTDSNKPYWRNELGPEDSDATIKNKVGGGIVTDPGAEDLWFDPNGSLTTSPTTIESLRTAFNLQKILELAARAGTRYIETVKAFFGVNSSDARMQRPEYIVGIKKPLVISEVLNTTGGEELPQGNMSGHGVGVAQGHVGTFFAEEHGWIIGIVSMLPMPSYMTATHPQFFKIDRFQYLWPQLTNLGEQEITNKEIYLRSDEPDETWGYTIRYGEYRYMPPRVAGDYLTNLDFWHSSRKFESQPTLSQDFIEMKPDAENITRIFAVQDGTDYLYAHILNKVTANRPLPYWGTPTL